jgi:ribosomal protein L37AE/L43A
MQEVIQENKKELEFILCPNKKYKCPDCEKEFSHIERCKDGKDRCKLCKRKMVTNPFYNPDYGKRKEYVGIKNFSKQEKVMIIRKHQKAGMSYEKAKRQVEVDLNVIKGIKIKKVSPECPESQNLKVLKDRSELNKVLVKGLGFKEKRK